MRRVFRIIPWLILCIPFILLAYFYDSIASEVLIARSFDGSNSISAPKSIFTVFRVPLIEVVCAAAIETMLLRFSKSESDYYSIWIILLCTIAFKSLFQELEFISSAVYSAPDYANIFFYVTIVIIVCGIILTIIKGRNVFTNFRSSDFKLNHIEKIVLTSLLVIYIGLAFVPMIIFR
jgi:uncharacterized membrane protein